MKEIPQEMKAQAESDGLPSHQPTPPTPPNKTLKDVMADCVSALSLGQEDLISLQESYWLTKKAPTEKP